jgi:hypothetical protein
LLHATLRWFVALERADQAEADGAWRRMLRQGELPTWVVATASAYMHARLGDPDAAAHDLDGLDAADLAEIPRDQEWLTTQAQVCLAAVAAGRHDLVARCHELLEPYAHLGVFEGAAAVDHGVVARFLATAASTLGHHDAARRHVDDALAATAGSGRLVMALTRADCGAALARSDDPEDRRRGLALVEAAVTELHGLGVGVAPDLERPLPGTSGRAAAETGEEAERGAGLVREGDVWAVTYSGATVRVRHAKGIADLAILLGRPHQEVHVRMLEGVPAGIGPMSPQVALDDRALAEYRQRLTDLEEELDEADRNADIGRAAELAAERDVLVDELTRSVGLGGRRRTVGSDPDERLRKAVSARVRSSIERIESVHPDLARHLRSSIRTGYWCAYRPERDVIWHVQE